MYGNARDHRRVDRAVLIPLLRRILPLHWQSFHLIEDVPPVEDPSEYRVNVVQVRLSLVREEELHTTSSYQGGHNHNFSNMKETWPREENESNITYISRRREIRVQK